MSRLEANAARICLSESSARERFGVGIVRLVLPVAVIAGVKYYSEAQLVRKCNEKPGSHFRVEPNHRERMAARS